MTELSIDTKKKTARVQLDLRGETEPIEIEITRYSLKIKGEEAQVTVEEVNASREWLVVALRRFVVSRSFRWPAAAGTFLKLLT
jgi:HSP20 family molecular chaperone IbpA